MPNSDMTTPAAREAYEAFRKFMNESGVGSVFLPGWDYVGAISQVAWTAAAEAAMAVEREAICAEADLIRRSYKNNRAQAAIERIMKVIRARGDARDKATPSGGRDG